MVIRIFRRFCFWQIPWKVLAIVHYQRDCNFSPKFHFHKQNFVLQNSLIAFRKVGKKGWHLGRRWQAWWYVSNSVHQQWNNKWHFFFHQNAIGKKWWEITKLIHTITSTTSITKASTTPKRRIFFMWGSQGTVWKDFTLHHSFIRDKLVNLHKHTNYKICIRDCFFDFEDLTQTQFLT